MSNRTRRAEDIVVDVGPIEVTTPDGGRTITRPADWNVGGSIREAFQGPRVVDVARANRIADETTVPAAPTLMDSIRAGRGRVHRTQGQVDAGGVPVTNIDDEGNREIVLPTTDISVSQADLRDPEDRASPVTSMVRGGANFLTAGTMPDILAGLDTADETVFGDSKVEDWLQNFRANQRRWTEAYANAEADNPNASRLGAGLAIASSLFAPGSVARNAVTSGSAAGRMGRAAGIGATYAAVPEALHGEHNIDEDTGAWLADTAASAAGGAGLGLAFGGLGELAQAGNAARLRAVADELDESSAPLRTRAAGARTVGYQRLVEDLPGGSEQARRVLHETGVMPRGTMLGTVDEAVERARVGERTAGEGIGRVRSQMEELTPDSMRGMPVLGRQPGMVDPEPMAQAYDDIVRQYEGVVGAEAMRDAAESLADQVRRGGPMTFEQAQQQKRLLDDLTQWRNPAPGNRLAPIQSQRRDVRRGIASAQDAAVEADLGPEALAQLRRDRERYQVLQLFRRLGDDSDLRDSANRLVSPTDYAAGLAGAAGEGGGILRGAAAWAANKLLRGREASMAAGTMERAADAARAIADRMPQRAWARDLLAEASAKGPEEFVRAIEAIERRDPHLAGHITGAMADAEQSDAPVTDAQIYEDESGGDIDLGEITEADIYQD